MIRRADRLAVGQRLEHRLDLAGGVDANEVGAELVADPELAADRLEGFGVEVRTGQ
jgi:hypothetical protein